MPRIPLAEIPNAPQIAAPVVTDPGAIRAPNISRVAGTLVQGTLEQGAYDGEAQGAQAIAQGLQALGGAGSKVAGVIADKQKRMAEFGDDVAIAEYDAAMSQAFEEYKATLQGKSENTWLPDWQKLSEKKRGELAGKLNLSPEGQQRLALYEISLEKRTSGELTASANRSAVERGTGELMALADRQHETGQDEEAYVTLGNLVRIGAIRKDQAEGQKRKWDEGRRTNQLYGAMNMAPKEFYEDAKELVETGHNETLAGMIKSPEEAHIWFNRAKTALNGVRFDARNNAMELVAAGDLKTDADLDNFNKTEAQSTLTAQDLNSLKSFALTTRPPDYEAQARLRPKFLAYDASADPDGTEKIKLQKEAQSSGMNLDQVKMLMSDLTDAENNTQSFRKVKSEAHGQIDRFISDGLWGVVKKPKEGKALSKQDIEANTNIYKAAIDLSRQFDEYLRANPNMSPSDAFEWLNKQVSAKAETKRGWGWLTSSPPVLAGRYIGSMVPKRPGAPTSDEILSKTSK